jgi:hypothetical protein
VDLAGYRIPAPRSALARTDRFEVPADWALKTAHGRFKLKMVFDRQ